MARLGLRDLFLILKKLLHWLFSLLKCCNSVWAQQTHTHLKGGFDKQQHSSVCARFQDGSSGCTGADWARRRHYDGSTRMYGDSGFNAAAHLVTEGCQVGRRLLPDGPDLCGRHQSEDVLDAGGRVVPELIPEGIVSGLHRLQEGGTYRSIFYQKNPEEMLHCCLSVGEISNISSLLWISVPNALTI